MDTEGKSNNAVGCLVLLVFGVVIYLITSAGVRKHDLNMVIWVNVQRIVEDELEVPSFAKYPSYDDSYITSLGGNEYKVSSYVDTMNGFGEMIRKYFVVTLELEELGFHYDISTTDMYNEE